MKIDRFAVAQSVRPSTFAVALLLGACASSAEPTVSETVPPARNPERETLISDGHSSNIVRPETRPFSDDLLQQIRLPQGFRIAVFARGLVNPRSLVAASNGDVYVAERQAGRVTILRPTPASEEANPILAAAGLGEGLQGVHGLALHDGELFMADETTVKRAKIKDDGTLEEPQTIYDRIPSGGQHPNRTLAVGPDGKLYVSIGSTCNACPEPEEDHATIIRMEKDGSGKERFAAGLRNTIGFGWNPVTGQMWGFDHGTDERGDNTPPEEFNRIVQGIHYGWPWCWGQRNVDWGVAQDPPDKGRAVFCAETEPPVLEYTAHAAPMSLVYYTADAFPAEYRNDAFVTMRGSWNRNPPSGYEVVRVRHDAAGNPVSVEPFATGWLLEGGRAHFGRLMGLTVAADGSLIVGDDTNGMIYRISWGG